MLATDLADVLRAAGVNVVETPGWKTRSHRELVAIKGIVPHHTAGPKNATGTPSLNTVINGRPDVSGPLCNIYLQANGTAYIIAAGRANHAGRSEFAGITDVGSNFLGVEAENAGDGKDVWEVEQMDAYAKMCAATGKRYGFAAYMVRGHKEVAIPRGRKIDPTFDMDDFRDNVAALMEGASPPIILPRTVDPIRSMLQIGDRGKSVQELQLRLGMVLPANEYGIFGPKTDAALRQFQRTHTDHEGAPLKVDGKAGPKTWLALPPLALAA